MELTYEEKLKLQDSKEHLQVVLGNVRTANNQLVSLLNLIEESSKKLAELEAKKDEVLTEISSKTSEFEEKKSSLDRRENIILEREEKLDTKEVEANNRLEILNKEAKDIEFSNSVKRDKFKKEKDSLVGEIMELENRLENLTTQNKNNEETNQEKLRVCKGIENEVLRLNSEKEKAEKDLVAFRKNSSKEMAETNQLIQDEKNKISKPLELLRLESEKLNSLKEDLTIIKARLTEQFKQQNPDKQLPIELQQPSQ